MSRMLPESPPHREPHCHLAPGDGGPRASLPEAPVSLQRARRALRAWATRQIIFANATPGADVAKIEQAHEPLLYMLM